MRRRCAELAQRLLEVPPEAFNFNQLSHNSAAGLPSYE